jgi:hypothetical protein
MKRGMKKLTLQRETLRSLAPTELKGAAGATSWSNDVSRCYSGNYTCQCSNGCYNTDEFSLCVCAE